MDARKWASDVRDVVDSCKHEFATSRRKNLLPPLEELRSLLSAAEILKLSPPEEEHLRELVESVESVRSQAVRMLDALQIPYEDSDLRESEDGDDVSDEASEGTNVNGSRGPYNTRDARNGSRDKDKEKEKDSKESVSKAKLPPSPSPSRSSSPVPLPLPASSMYPVISEESKVSLGALSDLLVLAGQLPSRVVPRIVRRLEKLYTSSVELNARADAVLDRAVMIRIRRAGLTTAR
jgi:hypothetical protein